jgi:hypothetical protein
VDREGSHWSHRGPLLDLQAHTGFIEVHSWIEEAHTGVKEVHSLIMEAHTALVHFIVEIICSFSNTDGLLPTGLSINPGERHGFTTLALFLHTS